MALGPGELEGADLTGRVAVVIDVLRATTTITTALANGAEAVIPFADLEECRAYREKEPEVLLGGERESVKPPGFDLGNSPLEYTAERVFGRRIAYTTTNGTRTIEACRSAEEVLLGALINRMATAERLAASGFSAILVCAGKRGGPNLEDTYCAGAIIETLRGLVSNGICLTDRARIALAVFSGLHPDGGSLLSTTDHGRDLDSLGFGGDVDYSGRTDTTGTVGRLLNAEIRAE